MACRASRSAVTIMARSSTRGSRYNRPIPSRRERLDELAEDHQHCRGVHATVDRDRAGLHDLVNYRSEPDHSIKRVLALHTATGARDLGSLPTCVADHQAPHRGVQALIGGNWLAHVGLSWLAHVGLSNP